ncbi:MAG: phosphate/phosphite/phosphonate ABC transporter substrate-binding protein [Candidatus Limnocylindria bacterium]
MPLRMRAPVTSLLLATLLAAACTPTIQADPSPAPATPTPTPTRAEELGTEVRPIALALAPARDPAAAAATARTIAGSLEAESGLRWDVRTPATYAETVEGLCAGEVDVAWLAPVGYVLATRQNCAVVVLAALRADETGTLRPTRTSQVLVRADSGIGDLRGLEGRRFAYGGDIWTAGTLYQMLEIWQATGRDPSTFFSSAVFAPAPERAVRDLYEGRVDGATAFTGIRAGMREALPDVMERTRRISTSDPVPNDAVAVRPGIPEGLRVRIREALLAFQAGEAGRTALRDLYAVEGLGPAEPAAYEPLLEAAALAGLDAAAEAARTPAPAQPAAGP